MDVTRIAWRKGDSLDDLVEREWLVTNGLGGYACGTLAGATTRRYHGLLVAALPNPLGRTMMLDHISEIVEPVNGVSQRLGAEERDGNLFLYGAENLSEFRLERGLPVWTYEFGENLLEKRIVLAHLQNTIFVSYRLLRGPSLRLSLRPAVHFRTHDAELGPRLNAPYTISLTGDRFSLSAPDPAFPTLQMRLVGASPSFSLKPELHEHVTYRTELARGYKAVGELWSHGQFEVALDISDSVTLIASTEDWGTATAVGPAQAQTCESERRSRLLHNAPFALKDVTIAELVLAADQFVIAPAGRVEDATRARLQGEELRSVIAGYHWFTDWGRDTMISLEGLTLCTGRPTEARWILHTFAHYVKDGLIPNLFPEGAREGLYHTADATLWFFHALSRYLHYTQDLETLRLLLPKLKGIVAAHVRGTSFGIHVDPRDGLLVQGQEGCQLTWMDAKCDGWVVTPRRGKAVEINALWYNALCLMAAWCGDDAGREYHDMAAQVRISFNDLFWCEAEQHLFDVVSEDGAARDPAIRPNQIFAISLPHPVLQPDRWTAVVDCVCQHLLTPLGLRSLAPSHPDFKATYHGDLRTRDAAYHQGTVWSWLIGPFIDAWLKVNPSGHEEARAMLGGLKNHLGEACIGTISEVFDAYAPFKPRGCVSQAWGVAELLRVWRLTDVTATRLQGES